MMTPTHMESKRQVGSVNQSSKPSRHCIELIELVGQWSLDRGQLLVSHVHAGSELSDQSL